MDPIKRKAIDESLKEDKEKYGVEKYVGKKQSNNGSDNINLKDETQTEITLKNSSDKQNYIITLINKELLSKIESISLNRVSIYANILKKIELEDVYAIFGSDNTFMFAKKKAQVKEGIRWYGLYNIFTDDCFDSIVYRWESLPWKNGRIFQINGIDSIAITAAKFIPLDLIYKKRVLESDLKKVIQ